MFRLGYHVCTLFRIVYLYMLCILLYFVYGINYGKALDTFCTSVTIRAYTNSTAK